MSTSNEQQYLDSLRNVLDHGVYKDDRTGTGTYSVFGSQARYNLRETFPLLTTKKIHLKSVIHELLWFLKGDTNTKYLKENGVRIWDEWAAPEDQVEVLDMAPYERVDYAIKNGLWSDSRVNLVGELSDLGELSKGHEFLDALGVPRTKEKVIRRQGDLGPVYGKQWRDWVSPNGQHIDQISKVIDQLRNDPDSRRIIVSAWNVGELNQMALAPCHCFFQFYTRELSFEEREKWVIVNSNVEEHQDYLQTRMVDNKLNEKWMDENNVPTRELSCQLYQRSMDKFLGEPFNIASYALLTHMIAQQVNMAVGDFVHAGGDTHIYSNHLEQVKEQLSRTPRPAPKLNIKRKPDSIFDYQFEDFEFVGYEPMDAIKAPVAI